MSLQVWLPLVSDKIENQGLANLTFTNTSPSIIKVNNSGKIGKCWERTDSSGNYVYSNEKINLTTTQSMFCWINFSSLNSGSSLTGICGTHRYSSNSGMGITIKYITASTGKLSCNTGNGSSRTFNTYCGNTILNANTWYHIGFTYDGATIRFYVNGVFDGSYNYKNQKVVEDNVLLYNWSFGSGTSIANYAAPYKLNDVRMYDHCLSLSEVKELARGLIVHYPFKTLLDSDNIVYDTSGNGHNGTLKGNLPIDVKSPRYNTCAIFTSTPEILFPFVRSSCLSNCTVTFWAKYTNNSGYTLLFCANPENKYFMAQNSLNGSFYHSGCGNVKIYRDGVKGNFSIDKDKWHFYTVTNADFSSWATLGMNRYISATWRVYGNISDLRIYSTTLSDEDILQLYHTSAKIAKNGTMMSQGEFIEDNNLSINKNGNVISTKFIEDSSNVKITKSKELHTYNLMEV